MTKTVVEAFSAGAVTNSAPERALKVDFPIAATAEAVKATSSETGARGLAWGGLLRLVWGSHVLGLVDQVVVSATSFLALVMIGRWTEPEQLGAYALGFSIVALLLAVQDSLITRPYSIQLHHALGTPAEHAFSSLALSLMLSAATAIVLSATAVVFSAFSAHRELVDVTWALAAAIPFVLTREFARRFAFAHLKMRHALTVDVAASALTITVLGALGFAGHVSAATALVSMGVSCAIVTAAWLYLARGDFAFRTHHIRVAVQQSWAIGKWFLSGQLALQAQGYVTSWLAMLIAGATVTGVYTACASIVAFANPFLYGFFNVLTPKSVRALNSEGVAGLRRQAARDSLLLAAVMTTFCAVIFFVGDDVMRLLYPGAEYNGHAHVLAMLAVAALAAAIGAPASIALAAAERARALAGVMTVTAILNLVLVWALLPRWGLLGAAYGMLTAEVVGSVGRWIAFLTLVSETKGFAERRQRLVSAQASASQKE